MPRSLSRFALALLGLGQIACSVELERPGFAAEGEEPNPELQVGPLPEAEGCVGVEAAAEPLAVDLFAVVDGSSSMRSATLTGVSKWYATKAAFRDFLLSAEPSMGFGLSVFPRPGDVAASCVPGHYTDAALPIDALGSMRSGALAELEAVEPYGQTPMAPALGAALELAQTYAALHPDRSVVVVLASDGMPTTCSPTDSASLSALVRAAFRSAAHVRTLVVAPEALEDSSDRAGFSALAAAGGTGRPLIIDPRKDFSQQLSQALAKAAQRQVACDIALPPAPAQERLDFAAINVAFDSAQGSVTFARVPSAEGCDANGGWYYDQDPAVADPTRINMCRRSCERLAEMGAGKLRVELGCKSVVR